MLIKSGIFVQLLSVTWVMAFAAGCKFLFDQAKLEVFNKDVSYFLFLGAGLLVVCVLWMVAAYFALKRDIEDLKRSMVLSLLGSAVVWGLAIM